MDANRTRRLAELDAAVQVWLDARRAAGESPSPERFERVRDKVAEPDITLVTVSMADRIAGMLLAEPFRAGRGSGGVVPEWGHVSMVFVEPRLQGRGVGSRLIRGLVAQHRWENLSVWTRLSNHAAQGLYRKHAFESCEERGVTGSGELMERLERRAG